MCTVTESCMTSPYGPLQVSSWCRPGAVLDSLHPMGSYSRVWVGTRIVSTSPMLVVTGASLRVTRHHDARKVVLSHWRDGVCVASTPIELSEVSALIGVLADALGDAIGATAPAPPDSQRQRPSVLAALRHWFRPKLAQITELRVVRNPETGHGRIEREGPPSQK